MYGFHISIEKKSFKKSVEQNHKLYNINAIQLFARNPRQLKVVEYRNEDAEECRKYVSENNLFLVSHATYLLNSANITNQSEETINSALNDLIYAEKLGAIGSVFHVGKHLKLSKEEGLDNMFKSISTIIQNLQDNNIKSIYILETSSGAGTELLSKIDDLGKFYHRFTDKQKENIKICIDTCHVFAAGYMLNSESDSQNFIDIVEEHISWKNVILLHLNDSKKGCDCHVDRHENIGEGCISKESDAGLAHLSRHCAKNSIAIILETPFSHFIRSGELQRIKEWITESTDK